ncbi:hypothetical protein BO94DRAFT_551031 [Aspergillus sclerotioniger CBS 115572]|uniref:Alpha-1,3-glucanase/mutanase n=1 Tax=Aspergillus sclerotioniger CBS 115572 TaxID=1450535 RepID=A0A317V8Z4_9EURO|nr:hypothetical protein BO94DRAFT_551031 [Aspergillus sclerotioniger CBS 115572]PWY68530.1 hypothetical protein BO94DRAFT_551031 [Aspergillus sclerotioniger CBS 115572]
MGLALLFSLTFLFSQVPARAVFAHFMVSNTEGYTVADWEAEMTLAIDARIDAFALNITADQSVNTASVANAFPAAENVGFYLFFSFDYAGNGPWAKADVIDLIQSYDSPDVYYHHNSQPFVSTFEGPANAADWVDIKAETGCFFAPDWSSLGAMEAMQQADGIASQSLRAVPRLPGAISSTTINVTPASSLGDQTCVEGWGDGNFLGLCEKSCSWGYCPMSACVCSKLGLPPTVPKDTGVQGYPIAGEDASYSGLCSFDCNHGYCPTTACGTVEVPLTIPTVSDFAPPACTAGEGSGDLVNLCGFACGLGFCPIQACNCTATGALDLASVVNASITAHLTSGGGGDDYGLCDFACQRGNCYDECEEGDSWSASDEISFSDDDTRFWCQIVSPCDYDLNITTMADLDLQAANMDDECILYHMLTVLYYLIDEVVANYTEIITHNNYNNTLKYYRKYVENNITSSLDSVMYWAPAGPGLAYFDCIVEYRGKNETETSCPNYSATGVFSIYYEPLNTTAFEAMLLADYGIQPSWIQYGKKVDDFLCTGTSAGAPSCHSSQITWYGIPEDADNVVITDPRVVVEQALPNLEGLQANILAVQMQMLLGAWPGVTDDVVQSVSLAVELLLQAVSSMQEVVTIGKEEEAWERKEMIEEILGAIFLVVPFLGEVDAISDAFVDFSEIATIVGDTTILGDSIYEIAKDPKNSFMTILTTLLLVGQRPAEEYETMAAARRDISDETIETLGPVFREKNTQVENLVKDCAVA